MAIYKTANKLTTAQAAYIAGLVDGEGTVTLTREHSNEHRRLVVSISSTEKSLLAYVKSSLGAGRITNKRTYDKNHTPSHTNKVTNRQALELLHQIQTYMQGYKAERAAHVLKYYIEVTPRNGRYSREQERQKQEFETSFLNILPHNSPIRRK